MAMFERALEKLYKTRWALRSNDSTMSNLNPNPIQVNPEYE